MVKKSLAFLLAALMLASCAALTACHKKDGYEVPTEAAVSYETLDEVQNELGFDITLPKGLKVEAYTIRKKTTLQVVFDGGYVRKAETAKAVAGKPDGATSEELVVGETDVKLYTKDGKVVLATWMQGKYSYCIGFQLGAEKDTAISYISQIK